MGKDSVLYPRMAKKPPFSVEAPGYEPVSGETIPRRHPSAKDGLITTLNSEITTVYENLRWSVKMYGNKNAVGSRKLLQTHVEKKKIKRLVEGVEQEVDKEWTYFEMGPYEFMTFNEYGALALDMGSGLRKIGHETGSRLLLFSATR